MALNAAQLDQLTAELVSMYEQAELDMMRQITEQLAKGKTLGPTDWRRKKLAESQAMRRLFQQDMKGVAGKAPGAITRALLRADSLGRAEALRELGLTGAEASRALDSLKRVRSLAQEVTTSMAGVHAQALRGAMDAYRQAVSKAAAQQLLGTATQQQAIQQVTKELAAKGITAFVDAAGRRWSMRAYAEMALRTATHRAAIDSHVNELQARGKNLLVVSNHARECELCAPWEGKVLTISEDGPVPEGVHPAGTLAQAQAAGFMHPNCRHTVGLYLPGVTQLPTNTNDAAGREHRATQRKLEARVRAARRTSATATTPTAKRAAGARVTAARKDLADHMKTAPPRLNYAQSRAKGIVPGGKPVAPRKTAVPPTQKSRMDALLKRLKEEDPTAPLPRRALPDEKPAPKAKPAPKVEKSPAAKPPAVVARMSPEKAVKGANPDGSRDNCTNTTAAFEMRMRTGKAYKALPRAVGRSYEETEREWGGPWSKMTGAGLRKGLLGVIPKPGQRAVLVVKWKGVKASHIVNVVNEDGVPMVYDAQSGTKASLEYYQARCSSCQAIRVDDKPYNGNPKEHFYD